MRNRFFIDCEFDGHNGPLISFAIVQDDGRAIHVESNVLIENDWVMENVKPILACHNADIGAKVRPNEIGQLLRAFIGNCEDPIIVADSPVDIGRFCRAISTDQNGAWASTSYKRMTFVVENVDCYPTEVEGAIQHNAYWDAMALREKIHAKERPTIIATAAAGGACPAANGV